MIVVLIIVGGFGLAFLLLIFLALCHISDSLAKIAEKEMVVKLDPTIDPDQYQSLHNNIVHLAWEAGRNFQHGVRTS